MIIIHGSYIKLNPGVKCSAILLCVLSRLRETTNTSLQFTLYVNSEKHIVAQKWERATGKCEKIVVTWSLLPLAVYHKICFLRITNQRLQTNLDSNLKPIKLRNPKISSEAKELKFQCCFSAKFAGRISAVCK